MYSPFIAPKSSNNKKGRRYIPKTIEMDIVLFKEHIRVLGKDDSLIVTISPAFMTALNSLSRGRSTRETESKKSDLAKLIQEYLSAGARSILKDFDRTMNNNLFIVNSTPISYLNKTLVFINPAAIED